MSDMMPPRQRLRSASTIDVVVPSTQLSTLGVRVFPLAAGRSTYVWATNMHIAQMSVAQVICRPNIRRPLRYHTVLK